MNSFESGGLEKDLKRIRRLSGLVRKKFADSNQNYEKNLDKLTKEELEDLDKILGMAEHLLLKYQHKKEAYVLLKEFSDIVKNWTSSISEIDDQIQEMLISVESSISEIKNEQTHVSTNYSFDKTANQASVKAKDCGINLTKSATGLYTGEYQQSHKIPFEQVV